MKNCLVILIFLFLFACKGSVDPEIPVVIPEPIVIIEAPTQVNYSADADISWNCLNVKSVQASFIKDPLFTGSTKLVGLKETTKLSITVIGLSNQLLTFEKTISVLPKPIPTKADTLCFKGWIQTDSRSMKIDGSGWHIWKLSQEQLSNILVFYLNGKYEYFHKDGTVFGNGDWSLVGNKLTRGGVEFVITELTNSKIILVGKMPYYTDAPPYVQLGTVDDQYTYTR